MNTKQTNQTVKRSQLRKPRYHAGLAHGIANGRKHRQSLRVEGFGMNVSID